MAVNVTNIVERGTGKDGEIHIGKDTPIEVLYVFELGKTIRQLNKDRFDTGKDRIERLHEMAMEAINASKNK